MRSRLQCRPNLLERPRDTTTMSASLPEDTPEGASSSLLQLGDARSSSETGPGGAPGGADRRDAARAAERELADELLKFVRAKLRALGVAPSDGFASSSSSSPRGSSSSARGRGLPPTVSPGSRRRA